MALSNTSTSTVDIEANQRICATTTRQDAGITAMNKEIANLTMAANIFRFLACNLRTDLEAAPTKQTYVHKNGGKK